MSNLVTKFVPVSLWSQQQSQPPFGGHHPAKCVTDWRPAPSVYVDGQQLGGIAHLYPQSNVMYSYASNPGPAMEPVSPPSSPEMSAANNEYMDYDVSPIDDEPDVFQRQLESTQPPRQVHTHQATRGAERQLMEHEDYEQYPPQVISGPRSGIGKTSIPTMRREKRKQRNAATAQAHKDQRQSPRVGEEQFPPKSGAQAMGWDDPTHSRPQVQPASTDRSQKFGLTTTVTSEGQNRRQASSPNSSFGQRMRQLGRGKPESIESRPAWNGASGRQPQVFPVREDPNAPSLKPPPKSTKRAERSRTPVALPASDVTQGASAAAAAAVRRLMPIKTTHTPERSPAHSPATETPRSGVPITPQAYPGPAPQHAGSPYQWPARDASMPSGPASSHLNVPSPGQFTIKRKPSPMVHPRAPSHAPQLSTSSSIYSDQVADDEDDEATWRRLASGDPFGRQPAPPPPPPPPPPRDESSPETVPSNSDEEIETPVKNLPIVSVMERKRPIPGRNSPAGMMDNAIVISLKTATITPEEEPEVVEPEKELPPVPPELLEPQDRIAFLCAKLEGLAHQRVNLTNSIKQLTELMPKDMLIVSAEVQRKREEEKQKVERMKQELSDIQQQEYELGLKLHRAYRRRDRDIQYDTGTLWVRRVTG